MADYFRIDSANEKAEKAKAFKKLMLKWLAVQETARKANLLLDRNPEIKVGGALKNHKAS